jgi:endoglucanase
LSDIVDYATSKGAYAILDPHDYARYDDQVIGAATDGGPSAVSAAEFATFWAELATQFASNPLVVFGLVNEPNTMPTELWLADANAAIAAIRGRAHATNVTFVPGNGWTGAHRWSGSSYGTANATVMLGVVDPSNKYLFEVHQYLDADSSGTSATCASTTAGSSALTDFTGWLETHHLRGFLGEFGAADNATCISAVSDMLSYVDQNRDVWAGWTWWSAGPWWGSYMYSIEPSNGQAAPQLAALLPHL